MDLNILRSNRWHGGQLLAFSALDGPTDFFDGLTGRTTIGRPGIEFKIPAECEIAFDINEPVFSSLIAGDFFEFRGAHSVVCGAFVDAYHMLIQGSCAIGQLDEGIQIACLGDKTLVGSTEHFDPSKLDLDLDAITAERGKWLEGQSLPTAARQDSARAFSKALSIMKNQVCSPQGLIQHRWTTPDRWPHRGMWLWDSVFHAIGWRHIDIDLAREMITAMIEVQRSDGFLPHAIMPTGTSDITQPPILSWGVKLIHDIETNLDWIEALFPKLAAYVAWDLENRDSNGDGLVEWFIEADENCRSGESGMDNSPRFDAATQLDAVDFNSFLALECEVLSQFADLLGRDEEGAVWSERHSDLCRRINSRLWSDDAGFYVDYDVEAGRPSDLLASSGFLPLICGAASTEQAAMLAKHVTNPQTFGTPLPIPSIAANHPEHYAKDMWRGPVWINLNWLIAYGFDRYGFTETASLIRAKTIDEIETQHETFGTFFEFYDDRQQAAPPRLLRKGQCAPEVSPFHQVFHDYGWSATLYVDLICTQNSR